MPPFRRSRCGHRLSARNDRGRRPETLALSGERFHAIVVETGAPTDEVDGTLFLVTDAQLAAADHYEVAAYRRAEVRLRSGRTA